MTRPTFEGILDSEVVAGSFEFPANWSAWGSSKIGVMATTSPPPRSNGFEVLPPACFALEPDFARATTLGRLAEAVRRFTSKIVKREVRSTSLPTQFDRGHFRQWLSGHVAHQLWIGGVRWGHIDIEVRRLYALDIERFIDENIMLIGDLKFNAS